MKRIIVGQHISPEFKQRARELRKSQSFAERVLWKHLRGSQLKGLRFRRQQIIEGLIVDFYSHKHNLVIEIDGPSHFTDASNDTSRDDLLKSRGLRIMRVTNNQVMNNIDGVLVRIIEICSE